MSFSELKLCSALVRALRDADYQAPTPIQLQAIPPILAGRDLLGCAQTGTGKTAAFALPTLQRLSEQPAQPGLRRPRALVLAPTRELVSQIAESFRNYGRYTGLRHAAVFGGVSQHPQVKAIDRGVDILVATPGRLLDLLTQGLVDLGSVQILILDEADQMLDMGFIHDLKRIVARVPRQRQTLLFSATMPAEIRRLADQWLRNPAEVSVARQATPAERVEQSVYFVDRNQKAELLAHYLRDQAATRALVFTRTKHGADKLVRSLQRAGIRAEAIHGNKSQNARQRALAQFKSPSPPVLVATDIASRGLDIDSVSHVINFDLPMTAEIYVHRIGRTARAGASGIAITLCDREERSMLRDIERLTRQRLLVASHALASGHEAAEPHRADTAVAGQPSGRDRNREPGRRPFGRPQDVRHRGGRPAKRGSRRLSAV
jgi:ATP-dependent RNA helicase RhlE